MNRNINFAGIMLTTWMLVSVSQIRASQMVPLSLDQLAARAQRVIHGKVLSKTCLRDERGEIYTKIDVEVYEVWKGAATNRFVIVQAGGILGEEAMEAVGQQQYQMGEEIVDFLVVNWRGEGVSIAASRGKFTVSENPKTHQKQVLNLFWLEPPKPGGGASLQSVKVAPSPHVIALDDFRLRIKGGVR